MDRHTCKNCERVYNYCRSCVLKPIPWREAGFCSRECSAAFKAAQKVEVVVTEIAPTETQEPITEVEIKPVIKKKIKKEKEMNSSIDSYTSSFSTVSAPIEDTKTALETE